MAEPLSYLLSCEAVKFIKYLSKLIAIAGIFILAMEPESLKHTLLSLLIILIGVTGILFIEKYNNYE